MDVEKLRTSGTKILTQWVPSHVDIKGNEDTGVLANKGREEEQPVVPASFADCKAAIRRGLAELWEDAFRDNDDNSISEVRKLAQRICNPRDPVEQLDRGEAVQVFRMRAEHTLLRGSMFRTKWTPHPSPVACMVLLSSRLPMSFFFRARPWRWSEIHSCRGESDLAMFLWGSLAQLKAAVKMIEVFLHRVGK